MNVEEFVSVTVCLHDVLCETVCIGVIRSVLLVVVVGNDIDCLASGFVLDMC